MLFPLFFISLSAFLFDRLGSSACCHWTAENMDHILESGDKMNLDSLQLGLILDTETFFISNLPFAVRWIVESSKAMGLPTLTCTNKNTRSDHFGQN